MIAQLSKNSVVVLLASLFTLCCLSAELKSIRDTKAKQEIEAKAKEAERLEAEEKADEAQAKNRWSFRMDDKNQETYWLHISNRPTNCKGNLRAVKTRWQMNKHELIKELCWLKNPGDKVVTIIDPDAYLFGTTKIDATLFEYIPSNKEKREAARAETNRLMLEYLNKSYEESRKSNERMLERMMPVPVMIID